MPSRREASSLPVIPLMFGLIGCEGSLGSDGSQLELSLPEMSGGVAFATAAIPGSSGYDLFWVPRGVGLQAPFQLTNTSSDDVQPAVARDGSLMAFVRQGIGIFLIESDGRVRQLTDTQGRPLADSLPAVSADGNRVAWVRERTDRPIGDTGFFETEVWVANADGTEARAVNPREGVVQDAPAFEPLARSTRIAWSEFDATSLGPNGPVNYGIWLHDLAAFSGRFVCRGPYETQGGDVLRCFGQHLTWPDRNRLILPQQLLEIDPNAGPLTTNLPRFLSGIAGLPGAPDRNPSPAGFFPPFPLSASFLGDQMVLDGVFLPLGGDLPSLTFFTAARDGATPNLLEIDGQQGDIDASGTASYLFSLATPQLMP